MSSVIKQPLTDRMGRRIAPSPVRPENAWAISDAQELETFGNWSSKPIMVPPKDASTRLAKSMLRQSGLFASKQDRWSQLIKDHRDEFQQVREIDMHQASIRLPKRKLFVSVTKQKHFDQITDPIPACVQTRLDEFIKGPGQQSGVKIYYLKPLCIELGDELIFTDRESVDLAVKQIQDEVFSAYRKRYAYQRPSYLAAKALRHGAALPLRACSYLANGRRRKLEAYQRKLEFERRKTAMSAVNVHHMNRSSGCTFDEMLELTNPLQHHDVVDQFAAVEKLSDAKRRALLKTGAQAVPWFAALSITALYLYKISITVTPPLLVCDPAFVAEMPGSKGELLKIGHFDEVAGITHVEI